MRSPYSSSTSSQYSLNCFLFNPFALILFTHFTTGTITCCKLKTFPHRILVNNAVIFSERTTKKLSSKTTARGLYQSLTVLHQCIHLNVCLNPIVDFLDMTLLSAMCMILSFFYGVTQSQTCTTQKAQRAKLST